MEHAFNVRMTADAMISLVIVLMFFNILSVYSRVQQEMYFELFSLGILAVTLANPFRLLAAST